ncbi:hypothetical protein Musp01_06070 [Muricauda sp. NBRC 101325]|nr:hypothetical protein Musp01_06070 [Muricauda sp. NBRC 101325]
MILGEVTEDGPIKNTNRINDVIVERERSLVSFEHQSAEDASLVKETLNNLRQPNRSIDSYFSFLNPYTS